MSQIPASGSPPTNLIPINSGTPDIGTQLTAILNEYKASVADKKLTLNEAWKICVEIVGDAIIDVQAFEIPGADKKAYVMGLGASIFVAFIAPLGIPGLPSALQFASPLFEGLIKDGFMLALDGTIESLVTILNKHNVLQTAKG